MGKKIRPGIHSSVRKRNPSDTIENFFLFWVENSKGSIWTQVLAQSWFQTLSLKVEPDEPKIWLIFMSPPENVEPFIFHSGLE